ncbi:MAG: signal peptidase II [Gemmataceae bacterium]
MTSKRSYLWLFFTLAIFGLAADQATKYGMFRWLYDKPGNEAEVVTGWFRFTTQFDVSVPTSTNEFHKSLQTWSAPVMPHVNKGALFGLGDKHKDLANGIFALISFTAGIAILIWATRKHVAEDGWLVAALGLILGGAIGNCYDRIVFHGVRDFLYFYWFEFPVFNVADCCLVVGTTMLLLQAVFGKGHTPESAPAAATPPVNVTSPT